MSSQLSYRLHGREQRPKTRRKHYRDELDTGQVKASAKVAESLFRKAVGDGPQRRFTVSSGGLQSTPSFAQLTVSWMRRPRSCTQIN